MHAHLSIYKLTKWTKDPGILSSLINLHEIVNRISHFVICKLKLHRFLYIFILKVHT
jgi:hypothetical protein